MPDLELDDRIRGLVTAAVKTAPNAPRVDFGDAPATAKHPPWLRRGVIALATLLAAGGGYVVLQPASDDHDVDTGGHTTSTIPAPAPKLPPTIVTAGPDGIVERIGDDAKSITTEPMAIALALDDGTFVAQRRSGASHGDGAPWPKSETSVVRVDAGGHITRMFDAISGFVTLHDFAVVDDHRLLLYSVANYDDPMDPKEELYALDIDSGTHPVDVGRVGGWEWGTSRLTLGSTGLIVGTSHDVCCSAGSFLAMAVPGSPAAARPLPKTADFGLQDHYEDGCTCPTKFAVDPDGTAVYWMNPINGENVLTVVRASLDDPLHHTEVAPASRIDPREVGRITLDADDTRYVVSFTTIPGTGETQAPKLTVPGESHGLEGSVATLGPNG